MSAGTEANQDVDDLEVKYILIVGRREIRASDGPGRWGSPPVVSQSQAVRS